MTSSDFHFFGSWFGIFPDVYWKAFCFLDELNYLWLFFCLFSIDYQKSCLLLHMNTKAVMLFEMLSPNFSIFYIFSFDSKEIPLIFVGFFLNIKIKGFPDGASGKEPAC